MQQFACQYITDWVSGNETVELQYRLEVFFRADVAFPPLFDAIILIPGFWSAAFLTYLLSTYRDDYIRNNQDDIDKTITVQINTWTFNNQSTLKERARQVIENPLKQSE